MSKKLIKLKMKINKNIGARVEVRKLLIDINPKDKFKYLKKVTGVIVENEGYQQYWYTSDGIYKIHSKHIIKDDCYPTFAIKLDDGIFDIAGNNIVVIREMDLKFLDRIEKTITPITEKQYLNAQKIIERYKKENNF